MPRAINKATGEIFELQGDQWVPTNREELAGKMALEGMTNAGALAVGVGRELTAMGRGVRNLYAKVTGDQATQDQIAEQEQQEERHFSGAYEGSHGVTAAALQLGRALPYLSTAPLGVGATGVRGLASSMAVGGALGGAKYSGDQGADAITGALLAGAGYGLGSLAGRTVNLIRGQGASARAAMMDLGEASLGGRAVRGAQKLAEGVEAPGLAETAGDVLGNAIHRPHVALAAAARYAALTALKNRELGDALVRFAGAGAGPGGHLGAQFGYQAPGLMP